MIEYNPHPMICVLFRWHGSVFPRALLYAIPSATLAAALLTFEDLGSDLHRRFMNTTDIQESTVWTMTATATFALLGFRLAQAHSRFWEGTTLLHQMQGEWFESVSCLMAFSSSSREKMPAKTEEFRQTLIRLMSFLHGSALEEIKKDVDVGYEVIDLRGLDLDTLRILAECKDVYGFNRVEVLLHMVQMLMTFYHEEGVLKVAPPILSRVYQTLSRGMVNFINAQKISDTMFPFPFAQLCALFIIFHSLFTPLFVTSIITNKLWAMLATSIPVFGMCCLNFTAEEIEMPYGNDPNDLPLQELQKKFNRALMMLLRETADHVPTVGSLAQREWNILCGGLSSINVSELSPDDRPKGCWQRCRRCGSRRLCKAANEEHIPENCNTKSLSIFVKAEVRRSLLQGSDTASSRPYSKSFASAPASDATMSANLDGFASALSPRGQAPSVESSILESSPLTCAAGGSPADSPAPALPPPPLAALPATAAVSCSLSGASSRGGGEGESAGERPRATTDPSQGPAAGGAAAALALAAGQRNAIARATCPAAVARGAKPVGTIAGGDDRLVETGLQDVTIGFASPADPAEALEASLPPISESPSPGASGSASIWRLHSLLGEMCGAPSGFGGGSAAPATAACAGGCGGGGSRAS